MSTYSFRTKAALPIMVLTFLTALYFYQSMPEIMASHWDIDGNANGYAPKSQLMFLMPVLSLVIYGVFSIMPAIDPLGKNIRSFRKHYDDFLAALLLFMLYIFAITIVWNLGWRFNFITMTVPAFSALFYCLGVVVKHAKRNWSVGIRTPWTMSDDRVWIKTHELGSKALKACAAISLPGVLAGNLAIYFVIVPIMATAIALVVYSFLVFRKYRG